MNTAVMYENRLCLFLDILGFSSLVKNNNCSVVLDIINHIKGELKDNKQLMSSMGEEPIATTFSDCIVLSLRVSENEVEPTANVLVTSTVKMLQDIYLKQQISLRGGISYGQLYHSTNGVFGSAMIKAYELVSKYANWPRVIFDKSVIKHFTSKITLQNIGFTNYNDGFWGVDCLTRIEDVIEVEFINGANSEMEEQISKLNKINEITERKLEENYGNPTIFEKYLLLHKRISSVYTKYNMNPVLID